MRTPTAAIDPWNEPSKFNLKKVVGGGFEATRVAKGRGDANAVALPLEEIK